MTTHPLPLLVVVALAAGCPASAPPVVPAAPPGAPASRAAVAAPPARSYWSGRSNLIQAVAVKPAAALQLPQLQRFRLRNGLRVLLLPDRKLPLVDVQLVQRAGGVDDPADKSGLADFVAGMLRSGTKRQDADAISETVDGAGASLGASTGYELTTVRCSGRSRSLDLCLQLLADLATQATFPDKELSEVRDRLTGDVKQARDDPATLSELHFNNMLYSENHPGGRPMTVASLQRIQRADLVDFYRRFYVPRGAIIGVSGDIDAAALRAKLERVLGSWSGGEPPPRRIKPVQHPPPGLRVLLVDKPDLTQAFFALGHAGIKHSAPDRDAVLVMNHILGGGGFSSRLMQVLRSKGGKTYSIRSAFDEGTDDGSFIVASFTRNEGLVAMLQLVKSILAALPVARPSDAEIRSAKGYIAGGYAIRLQTPDHVALRLMRAELWGLPESFVTEFPLRIERLTADEVLRAAQQRVLAGRLVAAVVGKAAVVASQLRAARIPFQQVDYLAPISAAERRRPAPTTAPVSPADAQRARQLLQRVLDAAGGRAALAGVRTLRLSGKGTVENMEGAYRSLVVLPDHLRQSFDTKPVAIIQVLAGKRGFIQVGPAKRSLPPDVALRMRGLIWRDPVLLPLHALGDGVTARLSADPTLRKDPTRVAIELFPPAPLPTTTVIVERRSARLLEIRYVDRGGQLRVTEVAAHKKVSGVLVPHRMTEVVGKRRQTVMLSRVEINPAVDKREITGGIP